MKVSICIAVHNQAHLLSDAVISALKQDHKNIEVIVLDDASTDNPRSLAIFSFPQVKYFKSDKPSGTGGAFNLAISYATGDIIYLLCSDDIITDNRVISDVVEIFKSNKNIGHVSRYYHQFVHGDRSPVRAWRCDDVIELANNPSGMAFRREAIFGGKCWCELSNKMFVEVSSMVSCVLSKGWSYEIMRWDTIAVRIHKSISRSKDYYLKRWKTSPIEEWTKVGGSALQNDFTSLIQIKNYFTTDAVLKEIWNFIKLKPVNLINPCFLFFAFISVITPRPILKIIPEIYRASWGKWTTREVKRP
ncbi:glycosyltransferase family 2 protein [Candidatus Saccharibacteria bacterium]|nr:MAG: glycosyltransferase family 2 protein [Candidatus Saccharibacteria bacterium]